MFIMESLLQSYNIKKLEKFFPSRSDLLDYLIMEIIRREDMLIGSLTLKIELDKLGIHIATATIGRSLKMLDVKDGRNQCPTKGAC